MTTNKPVRLAISDICTALDAATIGSKVLPASRGEFIRGAEKLIERHDFEVDRVPGQGFIAADELASFVSAGVGRRSANPEHYVCREHRGTVSAFLKREFAAPVTGCNLVVYTTDAYLRDPDVTPAEACRVIDANATHVLVAVLAYAGPESSPLPPYRLVWNLAGGNREAALWTADEIREKAKAAIEHESTWATAAD